MHYIFPYANIIAGILVLIVGFGFHWIGQLIALVDRDLAIRIGIWEAEMPPDYQVYENAIATADVTIGWIYGIAAIGLILDTPWGITLAWVPGVVLVYHSLCFWFWTGNQKKAGHNLEFTKTPARIGWTLANLITGMLAIMVAWTGI